VRSWTKKLKQELNNTRLKFVWRKRQGCNLRKITKMMKDRCKDTGRQSVVAKVLENITSKLQPEMRFC
jgi:hypothetical protein